MNRLETIISDLLREYGGGEAYFDRLDALMREPEQLALVQALFNFTGNVVASGRFGHYLGELRSRRLIRVRGNFVLVSGGLRKGAPASLLYEAAPARGLFTFVDDSYYSGTTERAVRAQLAEHGAGLARSRVIYDGARARASHVESLYRYYDHHGE